MPYLQNMTFAAFRSNALASLSLVSMMALIVLSGCSSAPRELEVRTVPTEVARPPERANVPDPQPVNLQEIDWVVLTPETIPENLEWVFIGLTPEDYERLSLNQAELLRWITEAKWRLRYYRGELPADATPPPQG